ncbi:DUF72 domain-containing protein [Luethyella okanaganae]|uniref:DUF72 domain-containing protein n=1 Tax=Luethyella okanaganae TaxID=69372 RepID=A0ABW1VK38_9MICO
MNENQARASVGTSGWNKPKWRGHFYPPGLVQRREFEYATGHLRSLEINTTFHGLPRRSTFLNWRAEAPDGFLFAVKGSREVTHDHRLRTPETDVARFFGPGPLMLQEKLGPVLWQTPPSLSFHPDVTEDFLAALPHSVRDAQLLHERLGLEEGASRLSELPDRPIRHAFEVRHESFLAPGFPELLRSHDVAAVVTNSPDWPEILDVTSDFVYVRLHGDANHFPDGYDDATLDLWAERVVAWLSGESCPDNRGRDVFVYFDNPDHEGIRSPFDAMRLQRRLDDAEESAPSGPGPTFPALLW